ncbi:unnamed protein product [marine sediment metagenome]|uniref:Uncharacterized protein n=1 Tax=marine sediment metagenome TaxID=412755 RepID=X0VJ28_9ZZZZ
MRFEPEPREHLPRGSAAVITSEALTTIWNALNKLAVLYTDEKGRWTPTAKRMYNRATAACGNIQHEMLKMRQSVTKSAIREAYLAALENLSKDKPCIVSSVSAGVNLHADGTQTQVFVEVYEYSDLLLAKYPDTGGLLKYASKKELTWLYRNQKRNGKKSWNA